MARIAGVDIPKDKRLKIALTYIYGVGGVLADEILEKAGIPGEKRVKELSEKEVSIIRSVIEKEYKVEGDLRREVTFNIKRLMDIGSYRGLRHKRSLPCRGQRTKTNSRSRKGPRKTVGSRKK